MILLKEKKKTDFQRVRPKRSHLYVFFLGYVDVDI